MNKKKDKEKELNLKIDDNKSVIPNKHGKKITVGFVLASMYFLYAIIS